MDDDILALLDASPKLVYIDMETDTPPEPVENAVYWGYIDVDETEKVINVPLPYVVFTTSPGYDRDKRQDGRVGGVVVEFDIKGVGESERQTKWVLNEAYKALSRKRINDALVIRSDDNLRVRREDEFTRPGGLPLFYGVDRYAVAG